MAVLKTVSLQVDDLSLTNITGVTSVEVTEEIDSDTVKTFDAPIPVPSSDGGFTVSVSLVATRTVEDFITLKRIIKKMKQKEGTIQVTEIHQRKDGDVTEDQTFNGCLVTSNKHSLSVDDLTARDLEFSAKSVVEKINNTEI